MSVNLLDLVKGNLTDAVIGQASSFMGESKGATQSGFNAALPTLLQSMISKTSSRSEAQNLFDLVTKPEMGGGLLDNLGGLFSNSQQSTDTMNLGGTLLKGLKRDGLELDGFIDLLNGQKHHVEAAAPAGFMDKLTSAMGLGSLGAGAAVNKVTRSAGKVADKTADTVRDTSRKVTNTVSREPKNNKGGGGFGRILPILLILGLLGAAAYLLPKSCNNKVVETVTDGADDMVKGAGDIVEGAGDMVKGVAGDIYGSGKDLVGKTIAGFENLGEFVSRKLADGTELFVPNKGAEAHLVDFIEGRAKVSADKTKGWFDLRRVLFETGSANLDAKSQSQIDNIVAIMKAYPNVSIKVGGHTDNTGDAAANVSLSGARAKAVMAAIVAGGVDASRVAAEGYGDAHPVADNSTDEGRQQNRRVSARVTAK